MQTLVEGDKLPIVYGAQDLSPHDSGAYTGEISGAMLAKLGCTYVVVGHTERRTTTTRTTLWSTRRCRPPSRHGLTPIVCVGEGLEVREAGGHVDHSCGQLGRALADVPAAQARDIVIAYEPVWAIGTGKVATPADAQEVCGELRTPIADLYGGDLADGVRILYGGSVKAENAAAILAQTDVDGALVGGASLDGEEFAGICRGAAESVG